MTNSERIAKLESQLSAIAGVPVEITIRGLREFTFSFESVNQSATDAIVNFFGSQALVKVETDNECGTFIYATV